MGCNMCVVQKPEEQYRVMFQVRIKTEVCQMSDFFAPEFIWLKKIEIDFLSTWGHITETSSSPILRSNKFQTKITTVTKQITQNCELGQT